MCIFLYNFSFSLHYKCNYGEFLVLVGSSEQLGLWDISKGIELQWMEGNNWRKYLSFKQSNDAIIQYKYVVCKRVDGMIEAVRWEEGANRYLNLRQLKKLFVSIDDVWEQRKISIFLKDDSNFLQNVYIIGKLDQLGNLSHAQEMQRVSYNCPIEGTLQTYWLRQILVSVSIDASKFTFNYLTMCKDTKRFTILGNETSLKLNFNSQDDGQDQSPEKSQLARSYQSSNSKKIKQNKSTLKGSFKSPFYSRMERNEMQIFQDAQLFGNFQEIFRINDFLNAGSFNPNTLKNAANQNIKNVLVFTSLKNVNFSGENVDCADVNENCSKNVRFKLIDLNQNKDAQLKECAIFMEKCLKYNENTLICWGNSKRAMFKLLIEYFCCFKKFSVEAAKKFLKVSSSRALIKRKNLRQPVLIR